MTIAGNRSADHGMIQTEEVICKMQSAWQQYSMTFYSVIVVNWLSTVIMLRIILLHDNVKNGQGIFYVGTSNDTQRLELVLCFMKKEW